MTKKIARRRGNRPSEIHLSIKILAGMVGGLAILSTAVAALDAWHSQPLAEFLVKVFAQLMLVCVTSIGSILAGQSIERRNQQQSD